MRIDKQIAIKLKEKGIEEFKIVRSVSCGIVYRLCYGNKKINASFISEDIENLITFPLITIITNILSSNKSFIFLFP